MMAERIYRGTSLAGAHEWEFGNRAVSGYEYELVEGFMDPADIDTDFTATHVEELPWEVGPEYGSIRVTGGFSNRLGVAEAFSGGGLPLVFHLDARRLGRLVDVEYHYDFYDSMRGSMPWVDGVAGGELRINESLEGLLNPSSEGQTVRRYGDDLRAAAMRHEDEMETLVVGDDMVDISRATQFITSYVRRPKSNLQVFDGYGRFDPDGTEISDWSDLRAMKELYAILRDRAPDEWDVYAIQIDRHLALESWGFAEDDIRRVVHGGREIGREEWPDGLLGEL